MPGPIRWIAALALLALLLLGDAARQPGFAEDAGGHADSKASTAEPAGSSGSAGEQGGGKAGDTHTERGADKSGAQGEIVHSTVAPPAIDPNANGGRSNEGHNEANGIDTSITVQPRRLGKKTGKGDARPPLQWMTRRNSHPSTLAPSSSPPTRNAIGVFVPQRAHVEGHDSAPFNPPAVPHAGTAVQTAVPGNAGTGSKFGGGAARRATNTNAIAAPQLANRAGINGTTMSHGAAVQAHIGGPRAPVTGINGTTVKPKH